MFNLNEAIKQWRANLSARPNFHATDLDELEDHLREVVAELTQTGLSEEEAFLVGTRRIGQPDDLDSEFAIADPGQRRVFRLRWMLTGGFLLAFLWLAADAGTRLGAGMFGRWFVFDGAVPGVLPWMVSVLRIALLVVGAWLIWRIAATDRSADRLKRMTAAKVLGAAMLLAFLLLIMRVGPTVTMVHGLPHNEFVRIMTVDAWFRMAALFLLPVLVLVGLWRLIRA